MGKNQRQKPNGVRVFFSGSWEPDGVVKESVREREGPGTTNVNNAETPAPPKGENGPKYIGIIH